MPKFFTVDTSDLAKFAKEFEPNRGMSWATKRAHGFTINHLAFRIRHGLMDELADRLVIRNKTITKTMTRFKNAKVSLPIDRQTSVAGTTSKERFTGWVEQPPGGSDGRKRMWTDEARVGGSDKRVVKQKNRFRAGKKIRKSFYFAGLQGAMSGKLHFSIFTRKLLKQGYTDLPFMISGYKHVTPGVYSMSRSGKLKFLAHTESSRNVRRVALLAPAARRALRETPSLQKYFGRELSKNISTLQARLRVKRSIGR